MPSETPVLGLTLAPAKAVAGADEEGVVIVDISPTGRAAESGLQIGDIIVDVGSMAVNTPTDVRKSVEEARAQAKTAVLLRIKRGDELSFVAVPVA